MEGEKILKELKTSNSLIKVTRDVKVQCISSGSSLSLDSVCPSILSVHLCLHCHMKSTAGIQFHSMQNMHVVER